MTVGANGAVPRRGGREPQLTRALVFDTALNVIDAEGAAKLTIRRLAKELGVATMTIYNYVATKQELLEGAAEQAFGGLHLDLDESATWQEQIIAIVVEFRAVLEKHPGMVELIAAGPVHGIALDRTREVSLGVLQKAGFSNSQAVDAISSLYAFAIGNAVMSQHRFPATQRSAEGSALSLTPSDDFPNFNAVRAEWRNRLSSTGFEAGLGYIVEGLARALLPRS
jgi:AcrR family transcriptional regulator